MYCNAAATDSIRSPWWMVVVMVGTFLGVGTPADYLSPANARSMRGSTARGERLVDPAVELLLVELDPAVHVTLDVALRVGALAHAQVLGVDVADGQIDDFEELASGRIRFDEFSIGDNLLLVSRETVVLAV